MSSAKKLKDSSNQREKILRDAAKLTELWGMDSNPGEAPVYKSRYDYPEPPAKDTSKYNPNKYVDIETFVKHPYFLNLNTFPWQTLALKLFYAGSEGNHNLEFSEFTDDIDKVCKNCVWNYILENEQKCADQIEKDEPYENVLNSENSRCLSCINCPLKTRQIRLDHELNKCDKKEIERILQDIKDTVAENKFQCEMDLIDEIPDKAVSLQIRNKFKFYFKELILVMGRRSGKSFLTVIIALYELYKLLKIKHPQKKYKLPDFQEIHIINVAFNQKQAKDSIFTPMKNLAIASSFFQRHVGVDNKLEMTFLTDYDIEENERRKAKGINLLEGTIIAQCGSSSAGGLVGKTCFAIIIDELAAMAGDSPDSGLDKKLYDELKPSLRTFGRDGKIVCLSNPKGPFGMLYKLYNERLEEPTTLILKVPTWIINANIEKDDLENEKKKDPIEFNMQYGAEFGTNSENPYLSPEDVEYAFNNSAALTRLEQRESGYEYYCHVDPSNRSDYYAIAVVHGVPTGEIDITGKKIKRYYVDHMHFWAPVQIKQPVPFAEVEKYLLELHSKFKFKQITFDQWHSAEMVQKLVGMGLPAKINVFNGEYKGKIYIALLEAFRNKRIEFYRMSGGKVIDKNGNTISINEVSEAKDQFLFLQKKWRNGRQIIEALSGYKDDLCDAVAAAIYECENEKHVARQLPKARVTYTGRAFR